MTSTRPPFRTRLHAAYLAGLGLLVAHQARDLNRADYFLRLLERDHPTLLGLHFKQQVDAAIVAAVDQAAAEHRDAVPEWNGSLHDTLSHDGYTFAPNPDDQAAGIRRYVRDADQADLIFPASVFDPVTAIRMPRSLYPDQPDAPLTGLFVCGPDAGEPTAEDLAEPPPEIVICPTCNGTGDHYEDHGQGMIETLGCNDCQGTGSVPAYMLERADGNELDVKFMDGRWVTVARPDEWPDPEPGSDPRRHLPGVRDLLAKLGGDIGKTDAEAAARSIGLDPAEVEMCTVDHVEETRRLRKIPNIVDGSVPCNGWPRTDCPGFGR